MNHAYKELEKSFHQQSIIDGVSGLLHWDSATYMPSGSHAIRGEQLSVMAQISHNIINDPKLSDLLDAAEQKSDTLNDWQKANLQEMRHTWQHATCLDESLVTAMTKAASQSEHFWRTAREENDFKGFAPYLKNILSLVQETAAAKAEALGLTPYDALIDSYDAGTNSTIIDKAFEPLEQELPSLIDAVIEKQKSENHATINLEADTFLQAELSKKLMDILGFDFSMGRQDLSIHPFCGGIPQDIRITTRYDKNDFTSGMMGILHETGHGLYEYGLPKDWLTQPVGQARGMSMHESQSLFVEMQLSRSKEFISFLTPTIKTALHKENESWGAADLYAHTTKVERSLIRVNADEVTYPTHVILRYKLEKELLSGNLPVDDLPDAWAELQYKLLGIKPDNHLNGCMQDIHWPEGAFGYFPTYTLGAMIAAQLFDALHQDIPNLEDMISKGHITPIKEWLRTHVHALGSRYSTTEILEKATGKALDPTIFMTHLKNRYLSL